MHAVEGGSMHPCIGECMGVWMCVVCTCVPLHAVSAVPCVPPTVTFLTP